MRCLSNFLCRCLRNVGALLFTVGVPAAQILYYRTESMAEKVHYLRSIGISEESMPGVLTRLPQLLSLDIKGNMVPKYNYLQQQLGGNSATVSGYPAYFSLSLMQRCGPADSTSNTSHIPRIVHI